jgi:hypothetical protein
MASAAAGISRRCLIPTAGKNVTGGEPLRPRSVRSQPPCAPDSVIGANIRPHRDIWVGESLVWLRGGPGGLLQDKLGEHQERT